MDLISRGDKHSTSKSQELNCKQPVPPAGSGQVQKTAAARTQGTAVHQAATDLSARKGVCSHSPAETEGPKSMPLKKGRLEGPLKPLLYGSNNKRQRSKSLNADTEAGPQRRPQRKVRLLWITHAASHKLWLPADKLKELQDWGLELLVLPPTEQAGRPDAATVVEEWLDGQWNGVVVSGPEGLVRDVRNTCARAISRGIDVSVQVEKFGW